MSNPKVLIVEDEAIVAMDIKIRLENLGYTIHAIASTGEDAIKIAAETCPDLILMDIMLGGGWMVWKLPNKSIRALTFR